MTLVASVIQQDYVWQATDRRLTNVATGRPLPYDTNKAIHFDHAMLVSYTGPAHLEGKDTAGWIADQLWNGRDAEEGLSSLFAGLQRAIQRLPVQRRAFAVEGVGWVMHLDTGAIAPHLLRISNCINEDGGWTGILQDIRYWRGTLKPHAGPKVSSVGQTIPPEIGRHWERQVRRRVAAGAPPSDVGRCLVQLIRDVSEAGNSAVGRGVLLSAIPRRAIPHDRFTLAAMPMADQATFKYFPEGSDQGIEKGPEVVSPGGARMKDFWGYTDDKGTQTVQVSFKVPDLSRLRND